jgi:hypothetical protein
MVRRARTAAGKGDPWPVAEALNHYEANLGTRGADIRNVKRVHLHLSEQLAAKLVCELTSADLTSWLNRLSKKRAPASVNRTANAFRAALDYAADHDGYVKDRKACEIGLKSLPDADESRNVILPEAKVIAVVAEAYQVNPELGLWRR